MGGRVAFTSIVRDAVTVVRDGLAKKVPCPGRLEFVVSGVDVSYINGLRRSLIGDVVTAAVAFDPNDPEGQDLKVVSNTGVLHNEFIGLRVSLVPMHLTKDELSNIDPDSVRLELDVANSDSDHPVDVTSRDIRVNGGGLDRNRVFPPDPVTGDWPLLTVLMPRGSGGKQVQRIAFTAKVSLGTGRDHARYSPVAACAVVPVPDSDKIAVSRAKAADVATFDAIEAPHMWKTAPDGIHPAAMKVSFESVGGIATVDLVAMAFEAISTRMRRIADRLGDPDSDQVDEEPPLPNSPDVSGVKIKGETETAGALVQAYLLGEDAGNATAPDKPADRNEAFGSCDFCGYYTPHPLQQCIIVRFRTKSPGGPTPRELLKSACVAISVKAQQLADDWLAASGGSSGRAAEVYPSFEGASEVSDDEDESDVASEVSDSSSSDGASEESDEASASDGTSEGSDEASASGGASSQGSGGASQSGVASERGSR